jgi:hypothetical protein
MPGIPISSYSDQLIFSNSSWKRDLLSVRQGRTHCVNVINAEGSKLYDSASEE